MNKKLQVFVSSTYTDLIEERQAAVEAILDAGHIPAGMELFKAGNDSQLETIYRWIDESDVYMLILGGRYGSIDDKSGISYTQLEYEYALSKDIPVFAVVLSDSFLEQKINSQTLKAITEQKELAKYQEFKNLVLSKIIREVDDCKDIKIAIYTTLSDFINTYDLIGWIRNEPGNHFYHLPENFELLLQENKALKQQLNENKEHESEILHNVDEIYLLKLIDLFQNKSFATLYSESTKVHRNIYALDVFVEHYNKFCKGLERPNIWYDQTLYTKICPYFENFNLLKKKKKIYSITDLGKTFYELLESKEII